MSGLTRRVHHTRGRLVLAALVAPVILAGVAVGVERLSAIDRALAAEGANAVRGLVYELPRGEKFVVPLEPDTDLLRFVVSAYRRRDPLPLTPRHVKINVSGSGARTRTEVLELDLPGIRTRITPEEPDLSVGDPTAFAFDVHDLGVGSVTLTLEDASESDGILVRAFRREHLEDRDREFREKGLDAVQKDHLAVWAWEPGWNELDDAERDALLSMRWRKVGAIRGRGSLGDLRTHPVAFSPAAPRTAAAHVGSLLGHVAIRREERVAAMVRGPTTLRASSDLGVHLHATMRRLDGTETKATGQGLLELVIPDADVRSIEWWSEEEAIVTFRTTDAAPVEWMGWATSYRVTPARPLEITAYETDRIVRVTLRRPMPRARMGGGITSLAARVDVSGPADRARTKKPKPELASRLFQTELARSRIDRYDGPDPPVAPSEHASFYVRVPRGGKTSVASADEAPIDVTLAELDETLPPEPLETRPMGSELSPFAVTGERTRTWDGFVPRLPSNVAAFAGPEASPKLRLGRTIAHRPPSVREPPIAHVKHGLTTFTTDDGKKFDAVDRTFEIDPDAARPLFVPVVFHATEPAHVVLSIEPDPRSPLRYGLAEHVTHDRTVEVPAGYTRTTFTVGDDLPPGRHRLRVTTASKTLTVLLPWASTRAVGPRWLGGAFEE